jgi:hypothetical protein
MPSAGFETAISARRKQLGLNPRTLATAIDGFFIRKKKEKMFKRNLNTEA